MPYIPGDNWIICDLSGRKVLMSRSRKTWDGLRVAPEFWYPRHPQLNLRAIPDRQTVLDGRPRSADIYTGLTYGWGAFCLISPNGTTYIVYLGHEEAEIEPLLVRQGLFGNPVNQLYISTYAITVDDDGALHVSPSTVTGPPVWKMMNYDGDVFDLVLSGDAIIVTPSTWFG